MPGLRDSKDNINITCYQSSLVIASLLFDPGFCNAHGFSSVSFYFTLAKLKSFWCSNTSLPEFVVLFL